MRIATWNVNSIRARVVRVEAWLARSQVDVLAIQESKAKDEARRKAAEAARARAELHAKALGVKVGELVSIVEAEAEAPGRPMGDVRAFRMASAGAPMQVEPGEHTVTAALRTVWRIEK